MNLQAENIEPVEEVKEDKGLLGNAKAELDANKVEPQGEPESMPHRAEDVEEKILERPDYVPEKFWDKEKGKLRDEDVFKSLGELEKQFSQGKHKAPENYDDTVLADAGYDKDDQIVGAYTEWAKDNKISQKAFDDLAGSIIGMAGEKEQEEKVNSEREMEKLGPNGKEIVKQNIEWLDSLERKGVLSQEQAQAISDLGSTALGNQTVRTLRGMINGKDTLPIATSSDLPESQEEFDARMQEMMNNERYANQEPTYMRKFEKEFEKRYPDKKLT